MIVKITPEESLLVERAFIHKNNQEKIVHMIQNYFLKDLDIYEKALAEATTTLSNTMASVAEKYLLPGYQSYTFDFENEVIYYE